MGGAVGVTEGEAMGESDDGAFVGLNVGKAVGGVGGEAGGGRWMWVLAVCEAVGRGRGRQCDLSEAVGEAVGESADDPRRG